MKKLNAKGFTAVEAVIVVLILVLLVGSGWVVKNRVAKKDSKPVETSNLTYIIDHDFVDLSKIYSVSKFRSAEGHDFNDGSESCRSMKHYFNQQFDKVVAETMGRNNGIPPQPDGRTDVEIYAPVTGKITRIESERMPIGEQIYIVPDSASDYTVRLFHVYKGTGIEQGSKVSSGQKIGVISKGVGTDIAIEYKGRYVSYFDVMSDNVFSGYKERGVDSRDKFILSKEYRDSNPVPCDQSKLGNQRFTYPKSYDHENDNVRLSGYINPAELGQSGDSYAY